MRTRGLTPGPIALDPPAREAVTAAREQLAAQLEQITLPAPVIELVTGIVDALAQGKALMIQPYPTELTTQQAAELLHVSRPYVIKLLESGEIPFRKVGRHRRIVLDELLAYKHRDDAYRREVARELTREAQELGLGYQTPSKERKAS